MGGKPCIRGMRVTVGMIVEAIASGRTFEDLLADYPYLEEQDIRERLADILFFKVRVVGQQIFEGAPRGNGFDDHSHSYAHAADAGLAAHHFGVNRDWDSSCTSRSECTWLLGVSDATGRKHADVPQR